MTDLTYGRLDQVLRSLGFSVRLMQETSWKDQQGSTSIKRREH